MLRARIGNDFGNQWKYHWDLGNLLELVSIKNKDQNKTFYDSERYIQVYAINTCQT